MMRWFGSHLRENLVGYLALFVVLGGTSYAATSLPAGSVTRTALRNGAVTHAKLAAASVGAGDVRKHSLTAADFKVGTLGSGRAHGPAGRRGPTGPTGPMGPAGHNGNVSVVATARQTGSVTAPHEASTNIPLAGGSWSQAANDLNLITGSMSISIPSACTGSFGNALIVSVDGVPKTFGLAPTAPASTTQTIPFEVSEVMEPGSGTQHTITAALGNSCTKSGEDFTVRNVKIDVVNFQ